MAFHKVRFLVHSYSICFTSFNESKYANYADDIIHEPYEKEYIHYEHRVLFGLKGTCLEMIFPRSSSGPESMNGDRATGELQYENQIRATKLTSNVAWKKLIPLNIDFVPQKERKQLSSYRGQWTK